MDTDDETLRQKAREAMRTGRLPARKPTTTWAGRGSGAPCTICGEPVNAHEVEFELDFTPRARNGVELEDSGPGNGRALPRVHRPCLLAWEREQSAWALPPGRLGFASFELRPKRCPERPLVPDGCQPHVHRPWQSGRPRLGVIARLAPSVICCTRIRRRPAHPRTSGWGCCDPSRPAISSLCTGSTNATHRLVFTLILRITHNRETAEEVTLDVFHDVWRRAPTYDAAAGTVLGWIMNQARSRAIDRLRFEQRKKRVDPRLDGARRRTLRATRRKRSIFGSRAAPTKRLGAPDAGRTAGDRDRLPRRNDAYRSGRTS